MFRSLITILLCSFLFGLVMNTIAQTKWDSLRIELEETKVDSEKVQLYHQIIRGYLSISTDSSKRYSEQLLQFSKEKGMDEGELLGYMDLGTTYAIQGSFDTAISLLRLALPLSIQTEHIQEHAKIRMNIANCFFRLGSLDSALSYFLASLELYESIDFQDGIAATSNNIGLLYESKGSMERALSYYQKSLEIRLMHGPKEKLVFNYSRIGNIYFSDERLDSALHYYELYLSLAQKFNQSKEIAAATSNVGNVYLKKGQAQRALGYYQKSLQGFETIGDKYHIAYLNNNLAKAHILLNDYQKALELTQKSLGEAEQLQTLSLKKDAYEIRIDAYVGLGENLKVIETMGTLSAVKDSIREKENQQILSELEVKYETKTKEAKLFEQELKIAQEEILRNRLIIGISMLFLLFLGIFFWLITRQRTKKHKMEVFLELKQAETENLRELDQLKSRFFSNISHEFRTPLTLIMGPVRQLLKEYNKGELAQKLSLVYKNGVRLNDLVSQLMDLSRLEAGKMELSLQSGDIIAFIRGIAHSFVSMADLKEIQYEMDIPEQALLSRFDPEKLQSILSNLLSNAFKYTEEEGQVIFAVRVLETERQLTFSISDNGLGIPEDKLPHIFERFYRVEGSEIEGAGIGLALTKELVNLHDGKIEVTSEEGKGSRFMIRLPILAWEAMEEWQGEKNEANTIKLTSQESAQKLPVINSSKPHLLLVEDNPDVRAFIIDLLEDSYYIREAENGAMGWEMLQASLPDLIITDVMMPVMDGNTFTQKVKTEEMSSHIPVIMLTAKGDMTSKLEGLATGADDYLSKPFDAEELFLRIHNLIEQRKKLRRKFTQAGELRPEAVSANSLDESFLKRIMELIEIQMGNELFSIEELAREMGMSRGNLHKKLKAITGMSPSVFIRTMRLHRAKDLLEQGAGTAAEISYLTGFSSPAYFSKCFKDQFGIAPGGLKIEKKS